ncbi:MAG: transglutaminase domain-containing protein [Clostridia bacterium]|nr:transglutaminase domain-containing protein [Clostridia bacterium]
MNERIMKHYRESGRFTYAGPYEVFFRSLPDDVRELGNLVCAQIIHRVTLKDGNHGANADLRYGDMNRYPWYRMRCEDDVFLTTVSMAAELMRLDGRGFIESRLTEHKLVLCCRYVSVLMASILKAKGYAARCRAGFAPYIRPGISMDHWVTEYFDEVQNRWILIDADGFFKDGELPFDQYDIPADQFDFAGETWLDIRQGRKDGSRFIYADGLGTNGLRASARYLFYDLNALMNQELTFSFAPLWLDRFDLLTERELEEIDLVAELLCKPDNNYDALTERWNTDRRWRLFCSPLVGADDFAGII